MYNGYYILLRTYL